MLFKLYAIILINISFYLEQQTNATEAQTVIIFAIPTLSYLLLQPQRLLTYNIHNQINWLEDITAEQGYHRLFLETAYY